MKQRVRLKAAAARYLEMQHDTWQTISHEPDDDKSETITVESFDELREGILKYRRVALIGDSGAGKTTTLEQLVYELAYQEYRKDKTRLNRSRIPDDCWYPGQHQALISQALFDKCQRVRRERTAHRQATPKYNPYILSDLIYCYRCCENAPTEYLLIGNKMSFTPSSGVKVCPEETVVQTGQDCNKRARSAVGDDCTNLPDRQRVPSGLCVVTGSDDRHIRF